MNRRRTLMGLAAILGTACLGLVGCGTSVSDNLPPARPATPQELEQNAKDMQEQMKGMGKAPR